MAEIDLSQSPRRWAGWFVLAVIVVGGTALFVGLSALNAGDLHLVHDDGQLRVVRGDFLPWGRSDWVPSPAFEPIAVDDATVDALELPLGDCDDELDCERRFYEATLLLAGAALSRATADDLDRARQLVVRAQLFPNIALDERGPIEDLTGGVHFIEAQVLLDDIERDLDTVYKKLERSRIAGIDGVGGLVDTRGLAQLIRMVEAQRALMRARVRVPLPDADDEPVDTHEDTDSPDVEAPLDDAAESSPQTDRGPI